LAAAPNALLARELVAQPGWQDGRWRVALPAGSDVLALLDALAAPFRLPPEAAAAAPVDFCGGWVGYLGYEVGLHARGPLSKAARAAAAAHPLPTVAVRFADRLVAVDHGTGTFHLLSLRHPALPELATANAAWAAALVKRLASPPPQTFAPASAADVAAVRAIRDALEARLRSQATAAAEGPAVAMPRPAYVAAVERALDAIRQGETYEVCLTTQVRHRFASPVREGPVPWSVPGDAARADRGVWAASGRPAAQVDALPLYRALRRHNPAPYGALLRLGPGKAVLSSSPERYGA